MKKIIIAAIFILYNVCFAQTPPPKLLDLKVFLEMPLDINSQTMNTNQITSGNFALDAGDSSVFGTFSQWNWQQVQPGNYVTTNNFLIQNNCVDWIAVELRTSLYQRGIQQVGLVTSTGRIIDLSGAEIPFFQINGRYYIILHSRNGISMVSKEKVEITYNTYYDFTVPSNLMGNGTFNYKILNGVSAMVSGDCSNDGYVDLSDWSVIQNWRTFQGYCKADVNWNLIVDEDDETTVFDNFQYASPLLPKNKKGTETYGY